MYTFARLQISPETLCVNARIYFNVLVKSSHITIPVLFQRPQFAFICQIQRFLHGTGTGVTRPKNYYIACIVRPLVSSSAGFPGTSEKLNAVARRRHTERSVNESVVFPLFDGDKTKRT